MLTDVKYKKKETIKNLHINKYKFCLFETCIVKHVWNISDYSYISKSIYIKNIWKNEIKCEIS